MGRKKGRARKEEKGKGKAKAEGSGESSQATRKENAQAAEREQALKDEENAKTSEARALLQSIAQMKQEEVGKWVQNTQEWDIAQREIEEAEADLEADLEKARMDYGPNSREVQNILSDLASLQVAKGFVPYRPNDHVLTKAGLEVELEQAKTAYGPNSMEVQNIEHDLASLELAPFRPSDQVPTEAEQAGPSRAPQIPYQQAPGLIKIPISLKTATKLSSSHTRLNVDATLSETSAEVPGLHTYRGLAAVPREIPPPSYSQAPAGREVPGLHTYRGLAAAPLEIPPVPNSQNLEGTEHARPSEIPVEGPGLHTGRSGKKKRRKAKKAIAQATQQSEAGKSAVEGEKRGLAAEPSETPPVPNSQNAEGAEHVTPSEIPVEGPELPTDRSELESIASSASTLKGDAELAPNEMSSTVDEEPQNESAMNALEKFTLWFRASLVKVNGAFLDVYDNRAETKLFREALSEFLYYEKPDDRDEAVQELLEWIIETIKMKEIVGDNFDCMRWVSQRFGGYVLPRTWKETRNNDSWWMTRRF